MIWPSAPARSRLARACFARTHLLPRVLAALPAVAAAAAPAAVRAQPAQATGVIEGRVTDVSGGRALENAQVSVVGTALGAITNAAGAFRVAGVPARGVEVRVRLVGFQPVTRPVVVAAGQTARLTVELRPSALQLDQVVVTGAGGAVETKKLGNTIAVVKPPENAPILTATEVLQGREPGVVGLPSSGMTGEGARIRIRGNASISQSNEPIIFVDGIRINAGGGFGRDISRNGGAPSRLDDIDPSTIERVEVLKGAAAATLYGTEASNGVIQIFTKRGSAGAPRWDFVGEQIASQFPRDRLKPVAGFARTQAQADSLSVFYGRTIRPFEIIERNILADNLTETGTGNVFSGQVRGGTPIADYFVSGRYASENGPLGGTLGGQKLGPAQDLARRAQGTATVQFQPRSNLRFSSTSAYTGSFQETPSNSNDIRGFVSQAYLAKPELANCRLTVARGLAPANTFGVTSPGVCAGPGNPFGNGAFATLREAAQLRTQQDVQRFRTTLDGQLQITPSLVWSAVGGIDVTAARSSEQLPFGNNVDGQNSLAPNGRRTIETINDRVLTLDSKVQWRTPVRPWLQSGLTVGLQGFFTRSVNSSAQAQNFPGPGLEVVSAGTPLFANEFFLNTVNGGVFAQEQLDFSNWIFATIGGRYDYASAFGAQAPGVFYPKVSLSVVPSDRPGWRESWAGSLLSQFRVRGAIGRSGRQPGAFDQFTTFGPLQLQNGNTGLVPLNLGNPRLAPEISTEGEVGFEMGFLENRVGLQVTGWTREVNDALIPVQYAPTGGFIATQLTNVGQIKARGLEIGLNGQVVDRPGLQLDLFANGAYLFQKVTSLGGASPIKVAAGGVRYRNFVRVGYAPGALFGGDVLRPCTEIRRTPCLQAGQVPYDFNGDGQPDSEAQARAFLATVPQSGSNVGVAALNPIPFQTNDSTYYGKPFPNWSGGFGGNLTVRRNWRLTTLFEYRAGDFWVTNMTGAFQNALTIALNSPRTANLDSKLQNPTTSADERLTAALDWANNVKALSPYDGLNQAERGDFIRWRELGLTYTAPGAAARRLSRASSLSVTAAVRNLALFTNYSGVDPETNQAGRGGNTGANATFDQNFAEAVDVFSLPLQRRFSLSVRLGF
jgi:TonB-linked SusC/RagA family outer membrane protein